MKQTASVDESHFAKWNMLSDKLSDLRTVLFGDPSKGRLNESRLPGIRGRVGSVAYMHWYTTQEPTETFRQNLSKAEQDFQVFKKDMETYLAELIAFEKQLKEAGAPFTRGRDW